MRESINWIIEEDVMKMMCVRKLHKSLEKVGNITSILPLIFIL